MGRRGLGSTFKRGETWWIQYSHRGQVFRESSGSRVRADATALLRSRLGQIGSGIARPRDAERLTFEEMAAMLADDYRMNERRSLARAKQSLAHLRGFFGRSVAADMGSQQIAAYVRHRMTEAEPPAKPATVRRELSALRRMFTLARQHGRIAFAPTFPRIEERNARTGFFEAEQLEAVLTHLPEHLRNVAVFAYLTGWRRGEVLSLRWANVDFSSQTVRLEPGSTKNGEGRTFPFGTFPELAALLTEQREATRHLERAAGKLVPWVFHHRGGQEIRDFYSAWRIACRAAGVPGRIFHDFRRTAVRNLERAGVPRSVSMKLTGHKTEAVFRRYAIVCEADLSEGVAKLAKLGLGTREQRSAAGSSTVLTQSEGFGADSPARLLSQLAAGLGAGTGNRTRTGLLPADFKGSPPPDSTGGQLSEPRTNGGSGEEDQDRE